MISGISNRDLRRNCKRYTVGVKFVRPQNYSSLRILQPCRGGYHPPAVYEATTAGEQSSTLQVDCVGICGINPARFYFPEVEKTALSCYNQHK